MCFGKTGYYRLLSRLVLSESLDLLSEYCSEFLIHAADVEGLCQGIDEQLVKSESRWTSVLLYSTDVYAELGQWVRIPTTYAGGARGELCVQLIRITSC